MTASPSVARGLLQLLVKASRSPQARLFGTVRDRAPAPGSAETPAQHTARSRQPEPSPGGAQASLFDRPKTPPPRRPPAGEGWSPIPGSHHGGYHRQTAEGWEYWYPDQENGPAAAWHPDDAHAVAEAEGHLAQIVHRDNEGVEHRRAVRDYSFESDLDVRPRLLDWYAAHELGVGSVVYGPHRERYEVVAREGEQLTVVHPDGQRRVYRGSHEFSNFLHRVVHEEPLTVLRQQRERKLEAEALQQIVAFRDGHAAFAANPSPGGIWKACGPLAEATRRANALGWSADRWMEALGLPPKLPRDWRALGREVNELGQELRARFPDALWRKITRAHDNDCAHDLAASDPQLLASLARYRFLVKRARGLGSSTEERERYEPDWRRHIMPIHASDVVDHLKPGKDGQYTDAAIMAALRATYPHEERFKGKTTLGQAYLTLHTYNENLDTLTDDERAKLAALVAFVENSDGRIVADTPPHLKGQPVHRSNHDVNGVVSAAIQDALRQHGTDPRPELYGEQVPGPMTLQDVRTAIPNTYFDDHVKVVALKVWAPDTDPIFMLNVPTGATKTTRYSGEVEVQEAVAVPVSMMVKAHAADQHTRAMRFRQEHRDRYTALRQRLDDVHRVVGDVQQMEDEAFEEWLQGSGIDPAQFQRALSEHSAFAEDGRLDVWNKLVIADGLHDSATDRELAALYSRSDLSEGEKARRAELGALTVARRNDWNREVADGVLRRLKERLGHVSDPDAAAAAVHPVEPQAMERLARYKSKGTEPTTEPVHVESYDMAEDPARLRRLLGWMSRDVVPHVDIAVAHTQGRAYCGHNNSIVLFGRSDRRDGAVMAHEYGHAIEHDHPEIGAAACTLRDERGKGEKVRKLNADGGGYDEHEVTYKDDWWSSYVGKWYGHMGGTEVLSMGVEELMHDPAQFARRDRDHFLLTVAALSGRLGTQKKPRHPSVARKDGT